MFQNDHRSRMVQDFAIVGLSPKLHPMQDHEMEYITSIQVHSQQKDDNHFYKFIQLSDSRFLRIGISEKGMPPISQIGTFQIPPPGWQLCDCPPQYDIFQQRICYRTTSDKFFTKTLQDITVIKFGDNFSFCPYKQEQIQDKERFVKLPSSEDYILMHYNPVKRLTEVKYQPAILERYPINDLTPYLHTLPGFCFPEGVSLTNELVPYRIFNFIFTLESGDRLYCTCLSSMEQIDEEIYIKHQNALVQKNLQTEKAYIIISRYSYTDQFSECLENLYLYSMHSSIHQSCSLRDLVRNFVDGLKLPDQSGKQGVQNRVGSKSTIFQTSPLYPPTSERALYCLFKVMDINNIIKILKLILLQKNVFFISSSKTVLGLVTEAFLSLIFPFRWEHVLIPILPSNLLAYLESPIPTIAGFSPEMIDESYDKLGTLVYLDHNIVKGDQCLHNIRFSKQETKFRKSAKKYDIYSNNSIFEFFESNQNPSFFRFRKNRMIREPFEPNKIRNVFLQFTRSLMHHFQKFITKEEQQPPNKRNSSTTRPSSESISFSKLFYLNQFRQHNKTQHRKDFNYLFTETSMFTTFIERYNQNPQHSDLQFFTSHLKFPTNLDQCTECQPTQQNVAERFSCVHCVSKETEEIIEKSISLEHMIRRDSYEDLDFKKKKTLIRGDSSPERYRIQKKGSQIILQQEVTIVDEFQIYNALIGKMEEQIPNFNLDQPTLIIDTTRRVQRSNRAQQIEKTLTNNDIINMVEQQRQKYPLPLKTPNKELIPKFENQYNTDPLFTSLEDTYYNQIVLTQPLLRTRHQVQSQEQMVEFDNIRGRRLGFYIYNAFGCVTRTATRSGRTLMRWVERLGAKKQKNKQLPFNQEKPILQ